MPDHRLDNAPGSGDFTAGSEFRFSDGVLDIGSDAGTPIIEAPNAICAAVAGDPEPCAEAPEITGYTAATTTSRNGDIVVRTTEQGALLGLRVAADQLRRNPDELAHDILRLCRQAAGRAGVARRAELAKLGVPEHAVDLLGLPRPQDIEPAEFDAESDYEYEPRSWFDNDGSVW